MNGKGYSVMIVFFIITFFLFISVGGQSEQESGATKYVSNLTPKCLRCLCAAATGCDMKLGCVKGYCGPFKISRLFWIDAGREVLPEDDIERAGAFEDCALQLGCAQRLITNYLEKYARDCNSDGVTNCQDYLMINFNGGYQCETSLDRNDAGRNFTRRYNRCYNK